MLKFACGYFFLLPSLTASKQRKGEKRNKNLLWLSCTLNDKKRVGFKFGAINLSGLACSFIVPMNYESDKNDMRNPQIKENLR